jgi:hypothetical protein
MNRRNIQLILPPTSASLLLKSLFATKMEATCSAKHRVSFKALQSRSHQIQQFCFALHIVLLSKRSLPMMVECLFIHIGLWECRYYGNSDSASMVGSALVCFLVYFCFEENMNM